MADTTTPQTPPKDTGFLGTIKNWPERYIEYVSGIRRPAETKAVIPTTGDTIPAQNAPATPYTSAIMPPRAEQPAPAKVNAAAQEAYAKTEAAILEQVAIGLKTNGNIVKMAKLGGEVIEPPQSDDEYRRIAKELIETRQFRIKDKYSKYIEEDGKYVVVSIQKMDENLAKLANDPALKKDYEETIKDLGAKSFNEKIPDASRRSKIAQAVSDSVEENTGTLPFLRGATVMDALMGLFQWIMSGFEGGFDGLKSNIANVTTNSISKSVEGKLHALGESKENIQIISDEVRNGALEKAGYPNKDAKKPTKLEDIKVAPLSTQQSATTPPSVGTPAPAVAPPAITSPEPSVGASPEIGVTAGAAAALAAGALEKQKVREQSAAQGSTVQPQSQNAATIANEKLNKIAAGIAEKLIPKGIENREDLVKDTTVILAGIVEKNKNLINNPTELSKIAAKELLDPTTNKGNPETPEGRVATALSNSARKEGVTTLEGALKGIEQLKIDPVIFPNPKTGKPELLLKEQILHKGYEGLESVVGKQFAENSKGLQEATGVVVASAAQTPAAPTVPAPTQPVVPPVQSPAATAVVPHPEPTKRINTHQKKEKLPAAVNVTTDTANKPVSHPSAQVAPPSAPQPAAAPVQPTQVRVSNLERTIGEIAEKMLPPNVNNRQEAVKDLTKFLTNVTKDNQVKDNQVSVIKPEALTKKIFEQLFNKDSKDQFAIKSIAAIRNHMTVDLPIVGKTTPSDGAIQLALEGELKSGIRENKDQLKAAMDLDNAANQFRQEVKNSGVTDREAPRLAPVAMVQSGTPALTR